MDETNVDYDMSSPYTLEEKGAETVNAKNAGLSERATLILAVTASSRKFPPLVIFKGVPGPRSRITHEFNNPAYGYPQELHYMVKRKTWNDIPRMYKWIDVVGILFCREAERPTYLIYDEFSAHLSHEVITKTQQQGKQVDIIPVGYTGALQALDKSVNKPFKDKLRVQHLTWMIANEKIQSQRDKT